MTRLFFVFTPEVASIKNSPLPPEDIAALQKQLRDQEILVRELLSAQKPPVEAADFSFSPASVHAATSSLPSQANSNPITDEEIARSLAFEFENSNALVEGSGGAFVHLYFVLAFETPHHFSRG